MKTRPFIILGTPRSGSTVLANALADHPDVLMYGELFHQYPKRRADEASRRTLGAGVPRKPSFGMPACADSDDGATYVGRILSQRSYARAVGFKLFTHHARTGTVATLWRHLAELDDLVVIDLRRDLLACAVSDARAWATDVWHSAHAVEPAPITVDPAACEQFIKRCLQYEPLVASLRNKASSVRVQYAELEHDFAATLAKVEAALGIEPLHLAPRLAKIARKPLRDDVANWDDLVAHLRASPVAPALVLGSDPHD